MQGKSLCSGIPRRFTKWPMVFPVPDQKALRLAQLLVEEVVQFFGVPKTLLSDRGLNLLSHQLLDVCSLLGIKKLNITSCHDGMVECFEDCPTQTCSALWKSMGLLPPRELKGLSKLTSRFYWRETIYSLVWIINR